MPEALAGAVQDIAPNDTGLPRPQASAEAAAVDAWIRDGAWSFCRSCKMINLRHLKENQLLHPPKACHSQVSSLQRPQQAVDPNHP